MPQALNLANQEAQAEEAEFDEDGEKEDDKFGYVHNHRISNCGYYLMYGPSDCNSNIHMTTLLSLNFSHLMKQLSAVERYALSQVEFYEGDWKREQLAAADAQVTNDTPLIRRSLGTAISGDLH